MRFGLSLPGSGPAAAGQYRPGYKSMMLLRRLGGALLCLTATPQLPADPAAPAKPNIILILADDLGYGDLSCQNSKSGIHTPRLDALAAQSLRFTSAHAPSALCTPTRYSIMTGQYCWRSRLKSGVLNMWDEPLIPAERLTLPAFLRSQGYTTGCFGKWHLGLAWPFVGRIPAGFNTTVKCGDIDWTRRIGGGPVDHGFDYYFGINLANDPPYTYIRNDHVVEAPTVQYGTVTGLQSHWAGPGVPNWDWAQVLPTVVSNATSWVRQSAEQAPERPFFLYLALPGPHQPVAPTPEFVGTSQAGLYGDYVQELDAAVGQVLDALESSGASTNTLLIFTSDNGPDEFAYDRLQQYGHSSMGDLRGIKNDLWEGGHRVPFLARWPGKIASGSISAQVICHVDLMRTFADLLGAQLPQGAAEDSVSFLPTLLGATNVPPRSWLILESGPGQVGLWSNQWMFIDCPTGDGHVPELEPLWFKQSRGYALTNRLPGLLYDLAQDPAEATNLYGRQPALVTQMQSWLRTQRGTLTWRGSQSGKWTSYANWSGACSPEGCDLIFTNLTGTANWSQTLGADFAINSLTLRGLSQPMTLSPGGGYRLGIRNGIDLSLATADLTVAAPLVLLQSQVWTIRSNHTLTVAGPVSLEASNLMICGQGNLSFTNTISGPGRLTVRSSGFVLLSGCNRYTGGTELCGGGFLVAQHPQALGPGNLEIPNNSTLQIEPGITLTNSVTIAGCGGTFEKIPRGAITIYHPGNATLAGPVTLSADAGLYAHQAGSRLTLSGPIGGAANLTIFPGTGTVAFAANNVYTGATFVQGKLKLCAGPNRLPPATVLELANSPAASLELDTNDQTVSSLCGGGAKGGNVLLGGGNLIVNPAEACLYSGSLRGPGSLIKTNSGTLTLVGNSSYSGTTCVRGGDLLVNGTLLNSAVSVSGGLLGGTGTLTGPVTVENGGVLSPGMGLGTLNISNALSLAAGATVAIALDPVHQACSRIQGLHEVRYGGTLVLSNLAPASAFAPGQCFKVFSATAGSGQFAAILPAPGPGIAWKFIPSSGTLITVNQPALHAARPDVHTLLLSWTEPTFRLQAQTNPLSRGLSTNWFDYPQCVSPVLAPVPAGGQSLFFRLAAP